MKNFTQLKKNLKKDKEGLKKIKIALLGDTATQFLAQAIKGSGIDFNIEIDLWEADFNQIERQVFDSNSELYEFKPEFVIIFQSSHKLLSKYNKSKPEGRHEISSKEIGLVKDLYQNITQHLDTKIIYFNYAEINDGIYGNFSSKVESSFLFQLRKLNYELMNLAIGLPNLYICDNSTIQNQLGRANYYQPSIYVNTEMVISIDALPLLAYKCLAIINSLLGKFKKCVIIDLDNTTWGGIIGDDGIENIQIGSLGIGKAFTEFQQWVKKLKERGVIVAVCSKNTDSVAREPFEKHPDMVLRLDDIAVFVANWENKADNIRHIQSVLNIGFDSMVFLDDNPFERNIVRENLPEVTVPELPEDPADYLEYLYTLNLFETSSISKEDSDRTKLYQLEAERVTSQQKFTNEDDFLESLIMVSDIQNFNKFNTPRVAQLSQRSNQFNLRTVRYDEADIQRIAADKNYVDLSFTLEDRFGDNGLICVVIMNMESTDTLFIDTWFMSCRVLKRGMENFVLNTLVEKARSMGVKYIKGEYISTAKNAMVEDHYEKLGFIEKEGGWFLKVSSFEPKTTYIKVKND